MLEKDYKYKGVQGYCDAYDVVSNSKISNYVRVKENSHQGMIDAIYQFGAVSVGVEADNLQHYKSGIYGRTTKDCGTNLNHAVVAIGYGGSGDNKYWIIQNSWSKSWGLDGTY